MTINYGEMLMIYPVPTNFDRDHRAFYQNKMKMHCLSGGNAYDEGCEKIFLNFCRMIEIVKKKEIDWNLKAEGYLKKIEGLVA